MGCPCVTEDGFYLFIAGLRVARKIASLEDKLATHLITVTRHGVENDINATYEVTATEDKARVKTLKELSKTAYTKEALDEAIAETAEVLGK